MPGLGRLKKPPPIISLSGPGPPVPDSQLLCILRHSITPPQVWPSCSSSARRLIQGNFLAWKIRTPLEEESFLHRGRYLHNTQQTKEAKILAHGGIQTRDPSSLADADLLLRERGHPRRLCYNIGMGYSRNTSGHSRNNSTEQSGLSCNTSGLYSGGARFEC